MTIIDISLHLPEPHQVDDPAGRHHRRRPAQSARRTDGAAGRHLNRHDGTGTATINREKDMTMKTLQDTTGRARPAVACRPSRHRRPQARGSRPGRLCQGARTASASCWCRWRWASTWRRAGPHYPEAARSTAFGGMFETRDPNWSVEAGAQAITEAISSDPKPDVLIVHVARPQLLCQAAEEGAGRRHLRAS